MNKVQNKQKSTEKLIALLAHYEESYLKGLRIDYRHEDLPELRENLVKDASWLLSMLPHSIDKKGILDRFTLDIYDHHRKEHISLVVSRFRKFVEDVKKLIPESHPQEKITPQPLSKKSLDIPAIIEENEELKSQNESLSKEVKTLNIQLEEKTTRIEELITQINESTAKISTPEETSKAPEELPHYPETVEEFEALFGHIPLYENRDMSIWSDKTAIDFFEHYYGELRDQFLVYQDTLEGSVYSKDPALLAGIKNSCSYLKRQWKKHEKEAESSGKPFDKPKPKKIADVIPPMKVRSLRISKDMLKASEKQKRNAALAMAYQTINR